MLYRLLKFVVRTRFSRPFLIFIGLMILYSVGVARAVPPSLASGLIGYYVVGIVAFFLAMSLATGGVMVMKSDRDYLFTLPLSARDLSVAIFFSQFIAYGVTVLLLFVYLSQAYASTLLIVDLVALSLILTSLGALAPSIRTRTRVVLSLALGVWTVLSLARVPFTPGSAFYGNLYDGTVTLVVFAALVVAASFRSLSRIELDMVKSMVRSSSSEVKSPSSFTGRSPIGAIYSMNLTNISLAGRFNLAGSSRYVSRRVRSWWVTAAAAAGAGAYAAVVILLSGRIAVGGTTGQIALSPLPAQVLLGIVLAFLALSFSQSVVTYERVWLSLTSLPPPSYFKHLIASKTLSLMTVLGPFVVADAALLFLGYSGALGAMIIAGLVIPGSFVVEVCWAAYIAPIQVKGDDMLMPAQFNLKQMTTVLPMFAVIGLVAASAAAPLAAVAGGLVMWAVGLPLMASSGFWSVVVTRLTENGFV